MSFYTSTFSERSLVNTNLSEGTPVNSRPANDHVQTNTKEWRSHIDQSSLSSYRPASSSESQWTPVVSAFSALTTLSNELATGERTSTTLLADRLGTDLSKLADYIALDCDTRKTDIDMASSLTAKLESERLSQSAHIKHISPIVGNDSASSAQASGNSTSVSQERSRPSPVSEKDPQSSSSFFISTASVSSSTEVLSPPLPDNTSSEVASASLQPSSNSQHPAETNEQINNIAFQSHSESTDKDHSVDNTIEDDDFEEEDDEDDDMIDENEPPVEPNAPVSTDTMDVEEQFLSFEEWRSLNLQKSGQNGGDLTKRQVREVTRDTNDQDISVGGEDELEFEVFSSDSNDSGEGKVYKERNNYASLDCAATIIKTNKDCVGASKILSENKDSYLLNKCSTTNKFVVIELCHDILVSDVEIGNFEFFSSTFRQIQISVSDRFPTSTWMVLGKFEAASVREMQTFHIEKPRIWARFLRIEFLSHWGKEYYCPVSLVRVYGTTMIDEYRNEVTEQRQVEHRQQLEKEELEKQQQLSELDAMGNVTRRFQADSAQEECRNAPADGKNTCLPDKSDIDYDCMSVAMQRALSPLMVDDACHYQELLNATHGSMNMIANATNATISQSSSTVHQKVPQDSVYQAIMKRLTLLETNSSLSIEYIDRYWRDTMSKLEKRQSQRIETFVQDLNDTVTSFRNHYNNILLALVSSLDQERENSAQDLAALTSRLAFIADELVWQKQIIISQAIVILLILVFVIATRSTPTAFDGAEWINTSFLSPIIPRSPMSPNIASGPMVDQVEDGSLARRRRGHVFRADALDADDDVDFQDSDSAHDLHSQDAVPREEGAEVTDEFSSATSDLNQSDQFSQNPYQIAAEGPLTDLGTDLTPKAKHSKSEHQSECDDIPQHVQKSSLQRLDLSRQSSKEVLGYETLHKRNQSAPNCAAEQQNEKRNVSPSVLCQQDAHQTTRQGDKKDLASGYSEHCDQFSDEYEDYPTPNSDFD